MQRQAYTNVVGLNLMVGRNYYNFYKIKIRDTKKEEDQFKIPIHGIWRMIKLEKKIT